MYGCEKVMEKDELSGSTQEVCHRNLHHYHHHHPHHHHHHPLLLRLPSLLHILPALNKNPVGLFHFLFLFCFFCNNSYFQVTFLLIASFCFVRETRVTASTRRREVKSAMELRYLVLRYHNFFISSDSFLYSKRKRVFLKLLILPYCKKNCVMFCVQSLLLSL